jgi:hypothetical protein
MLRPGWPPFNGSGGRARRDGAFSFINHPSEGEIMAIQGAATLVAGQAQVETSDMDGGNLVFLTRQVGAPENIGRLYISDRRPGSFTIASTLDQDTGTVHWQLSDTTYPDQHNRAI